MRALTYDDIQLIPRYSEIESRTTISLRTQVSRNWKLEIPLVASPMDTVCEYEMAKKMYEFGGVGCIHRFMSIEEQCKQIIQLNCIREEEKEMGLYRYLPLMAAIGVNGDFFERAHDLIQCGTNILVIDVAHGHHINVKKAIEKIRSLKWEVDIIAGNIATNEAAKDLMSWGVDGLRVGIGGGSLCTTRIKTGFGIPNVTCLENISKTSYLPIMADGGIRSSGDIAKALACGASTVMLGSLLAGTEEAPGKIIETSKGLFKRYRGSASLETNIVHGRSERNIEGVSDDVPYKGGVKYVLNGLLDGIKSALSYGGVSRLEEFYPDYCEVTNAGLIESTPHLKH